MDKQKLEIGHPLHVTVRWYDRVPEPPRGETYEGEVVGWRQSQIVVRIPGYSVIRIWKKNGLEVGNPDWKRRGFKADLDEINSTNSNQEVEIEMPVAIDTDA